MRYVLKFGGESLKGAYEIGRAMGLVKKNSEHELVVVVSALAGMTNRLEVLCARAVSGEDPERIRDELRLIEDMHIFEAQRLVKDNFLLLKLIEDVKAVLLEAERVLVGVCYLNEMTPRIKDRILSIGERLSAPIVSAALETLGMKSVPLTGWDAGIVTDRNFTRASPIMDVSMKNISAVIPALLEQKIVPVVTGFIAKDAKGSITTLGRGGSDFTASIIGSAIRCDEIWLCKNIDGIMTADPSLVPNARLLDHISYLEASEMAYVGAKVLHPRCIEPALELGIPVRVRNSSKYDESGTLIVKNGNGDKSIVKTVSLLDNICLINVAGLNMVGSPGIVTDIFRALAAGNIQILMISQGSSESNLTLVVPGSQSESALELLRRDFCEGRHFKSVSLDKGKCIIAAVGLGMVTSPGVAARIFTAVARAGINVVMIMSGSNEINISFAVGKPDAKNAVQAIHDEFGLGNK